ncbi:MAG: hypothetical protein ABFC89_11240 [Methanospirillum sp.]
MADPLKKPGEDRTRREAAARGAFAQGSGTGTDPDIGAVNSLPEERTTLSETRTTETTVPDTKSMSERITPGMTPEDRARSQAETAHTATREDRPMTEKIGEKLHDVKEDVKEKVEPGKTEAERTEMGLPSRTTTTKDVDWNEIENPASCGPEGEADYGTRPVSELTPPTTVSDKADLAAQRMLDRGKADREKMDRERIMSTATLDAAAARAAMTSKETTPMKETKTTKETTSTEPVAGERTIRQGAAIGTEPTRPMPVERPMTGTVVPPGTERVTPMKPYGTVDERSRMHAEDPSVHADWETQPQINAPRDVGIPTSEGQADAARLRSGRRRSDVAKEPRIDRRGGEYDVPVASGARRTDTGTTTTERRMGTETKDDRTMTQKMRDEASKVKEVTKEKARDVKEDVDRKI